MRGVFLVHSFSLFKVVQRRPKHVNGGRKNCKKQDMCLNGVNEDR